MQHDQYEFVDTPIPEKSEKELMEGTEYQTDQPFESEDQKKEFVLLQESKEDQVRIVHMYTQVLWPLYHEQRG